MIDLAAVAATVDVPSSSARQAAEARQATLTKPAGALGRLEAVAEWWAATSGTGGAVRQPQRARMVVFAGDHGVAARTSAYPAAVTAQMVLNMLAGGAGANVLAAANGATVRVLDLAVDIDWDEAGHLVPDDLTSHKIRRGSDPMDVTDALSADEAERAFVAGMRIADEEVDAGADLLIAGDMGIGNTTGAAALIGLLTRHGAAEVVGRGTGIDDDTWMTKCAVVRDAMFRVTRSVEPSADPLGLLAGVGGADLAAMAGFLLQAAVRGVPVILDGMVVTSAALVAASISHRARLWWLAGHRSPEPAHTFALESMEAEPLVDYGMRLGEGSGALVALGVLRSAVATLAEMASFASAGVSGPVEAEVEVDVEVAQAAPKDAGVDNDGGPADEARR